MATKTQQQYQEEIESRIKRYESRYGVESSSLPAAIDSGELVETYDVCRWLIAHDRLKRMNGQSNLKNLTSLEE